MTNSLTNFDLCTRIFQILEQSQAQTVVVCAGARNAPLVLGLQKTNFKVFHFFEERSAAFFCLGLIKSNQKPVALITTSGTAVAEVLPAAVEATYQGLPLIIISADRPKAYRQSGAPQSIEQVGLFSHYVSKTYDFDVHTENFEIEYDLKKPLHLNVCFDEPLIDQPSGRPQKVKIQFRQPQLSTEIPVEKIEEPLLIVSEIQPEQVLAVRDFILNHKIPTYAESLSQLRHFEELKPYLLFSSETVVKKIFQMDLVRSVIRLGGVPTLRFWRDLEIEFLKIPVFHFSDLHFAGLARKSFLFSFDRIFSTTTQNSPTVLKKIKQIDDSLQFKKMTLVEKYPFSEPSLVFKLSQQTQQHPVYLGNSLPIRHWDQFTTNETKHVYANRGANGIDGQVSTYLGWSENIERSYCVVGDLTALYDLAALALTPQLNPHKRTIVIINNFGGQIFQRVFKNDLFTNPHQIEFKNWAQMWNWDYGVEKKLNTVIELKPDAEQSKNFWAEWDLACSEH